MGVTAYNDEGRLVSKPGDTAVAKAIGTYPNIPESGDSYPDYARTDEFLPDGTHQMTYVGPLGTAVVTLGGSPLTYRVVKDNETVYEHVF